MAVENLLSRLDRVRPRGASKWMARCPAHDDKGPSLSVAEVEDGRILIHCFAGCGAADVLAAIGLEFGDLFPVPLPVATRTRRPFNPMDVLRAMAFEALVVRIAAGNLANGTELSHEDYQRLGIAQQRLQCAVEVAGG